uniref:Uncharacterized protein n=1 Tax=Tetradesmus obliquus TaxID=3088 RepID=A0A383VR70_TETOB
MQQALPEELRWHRVEWQPSPEPQRHQPKGPAPVKMRSTRDLHEWQPSPEPLDTLQGIFSEQPDKYHQHVLKLSQLVANQAAPPAKRPRPSDNEEYAGLNLTNLEQQGIYLHAV